MPLAPHTTAPNGINPCMTELSRELGTFKFNLQSALEYLPTHIRCTGSSNTLQCLRELPYTTLYSATYEGLEWFATIDGSFITQYPQISYKQGKLAKVPILLGTNTDEGTSFGTTGTDTEDECIDELTSMYT